MLAEQALDLRLPCEAKELDLQRQEQPDSSLWCCTWWRAYMLEPIRCMLLVFASIVVQLLMHAWARHVHRTGYVLCRTKDCTTAWRKLVWHRVCHKHARKLAPHVLIRSLADSNDSTISGSLKCVAA